MILIRVDGNAEIGMGHIMRCVSIARCLLKMGVKPAFITACKESKKTLEDKGFYVKFIPTDYRYMDQEIPYFRPVIKEIREEMGEPEHPELNNPVTDKKPDVILLDSYQITENYVMKLREVAMIACLEDLGNSFPVDLIINYNIYGMRYYYKTIPDVELKVMLGPQFIPLRGEFTENLSYILREDVKNVMITTGGSDMYFASKNLLNEFLRCQDFIEKDIVFHVVSGPYNKFENQLKRIYRNHPNVVIHTNVVSMKEIMKQCDVVISAAGSTVYEVCALGVPLICFHFVDNQRMIDEMLPIVTPVKSFGDYTSSPVYKSKEAAGILREYINDYEFRKNLGEAEKALVDGQGARRVAEGLIELGQEYYQQKQS